MPPQDMSIKLDDKAIKWKMVDTESKNPAELFSNYKLLGADVVLLLFDASVEASVERVTSFWLPAIEQINV